jgi:hypothetical protein
MNIDLNRFRGTSKLGLDEARQEISRFFDRELLLLAEERRDRAERLGIDRVLPRTNPLRPS